MIPVDRILRIRACGPLLAVAAVAVASPVLAQQVNLDAIVESDLRGRATGVVAGVVVQGELDFLEAWGTVSTDSDTDVEVTTPMAFPGLTDILVAVTVRALGDAGMLDPTAPLSSFLPEMSGRLGRVTLDQLLSHTSGLDNAVLSPGQSWDDALAALDDDAFVAEPGQVYSQSRYSYPMAARVLERLVGMPVADIATTAVLTPLAMVRSTFDVDTARAWGLAVGYAPAEDGPVAVEPTATLGGLPVLYTTAPDVLQLLSAWMAGGIRGSSPVGTAPTGVPRMDATRSFGDGVNQDMTALIPQAWANGEAAGFGTAIHLYPDYETALFIWSNGGVPAGTLRWIRTLVAEAVGDVETSMAGQGVRVTRSVDAAVQPDGLDDLGEWAGLYRNGSAQLGLRFADEQLWFYDGINDLPLEGIGPATFAYSGQGGGPPLQLLRLGDQRVVLYGNLAYAWESSELPPPGGGG